MAGRLVVQNATVELRPSTEHKLRQMQISDTDAAVLAEVAQKLRAQKPLPEHMAGTDDMTKLPLACLMCSRLRKEHVQQELLTVLICRSIL
jgi:hypothetical protein